MYIHVFQPRNSASPSSQIRESKVTKLAGKNTVVRKYPSSWQPWGQYGSGWIRRSEEFRACSIPLSFSSLSQMNNITTLTSILSLFSADCAGKERQLHWYANDRQCPGWIDNSTAHKGFSTVMSLVPSAPIGTFGTACVNVQETWRPQKLGVHKCHKVCLYRYWDIHGRMRAITARRTPCSLNTALVATRLGCTLRSLSSHRPIHGFVYSADAEAKHGRGERELKEQNLLTYCRQYRICHGKPPVDVHIRQVGRLE